MRGFIFAEANLAVLRGDIIFAYRKVLIILCGRILAVAQYIFSSQTLIFEIEQLIPKLL